MTNDFDKVNHTFLFKVLTKSGFSDNIISWIKTCIRKPWIVPLVNGRVKKLFKASWGIHQGCPLSPLLYIIMMDSLRKHQIQDKFKVSKWI